MTPRRRIVPVFVPHLGCPNDCVFCNQQRISGTRHPVIPETVRHAVEAAAKTLPGGEGLELAFYGGSFTAIPTVEQEALLDAAQPYLSAGFLSGIRISTRPDCVDGDTTERLRYFGVTTVELGVQSMCQDVLEGSRRGHTPADAERSARLLKDAGFSLILQMMTGLPGDTWEKSLYTAGRLITMAPDGVRIYPTVVIRDTELYTMWLRGEYKEHTLAEAVPLCAELVSMFERADIPVIRLGLNPTDELSGGAAVAGAYHPAFGELVLSYRYRKQAEALLVGVRENADVLLGVSRGQLSAAVGQRRGNIAALTEMYGLRRLKYQEADVKKGDMVLLKLAY